MTPTSTDSQRVLRKLREQLRALTFAPLMRGSIVQARQRCGRPNCACAKHAKARHLRKLLAVYLDGRTQVVHLRREDEERVRHAIEAYRKMWKALDGLTAYELAELRRATRERRRSRAADRRGRR